MSNIITYLKNYNYKFMDAYPFNEIDGLCFANLTYSFFEYVFSTQEQSLGLSIKECIRKFLLDGKDKEKVRVMKDYEFLNELALCNRFNKMKCYFYEAVFDEKNQSQFAALTVDIGKYIVVAYRGTDNTVVGWKEDFNMSFEKVIPSQILAVEYLEKISAIFDKKIILVGHSKGGNLAKYATMKCSLKVKKRILKVYNYDGPGFNEVSINDFYNHQLQNKIKNYIPISSVIGLLMNDFDNYTYVDAKGLYIFQHNPYLWKVDDNSFVYVKDNDRISKLTEIAIDKVIDRVSLEQRKQFIDIIYEVISVSDAVYLDDIIPGLIKNRNKLIELVNSFDENTKKFVDMILKILIDSLIDTANTNAKNRFKEILEQIKI